MSKHNETSEPQVFFVMLGMHIKAPSAGDAVAGFVEQLAESGLRQWTYRVEQPNETAPERTVLVGYYDGHGDERDLSQAVAGPRTRMDLPRLSTPVVEVRRSSESGSTLADDGEGEPLTE